MPEILFNLIQYDYPNVLSSAIVLQIIQRKRVIAVTRISTMAKQLQRRIALWVVISAGILIGWGCFQSVRAQTQCEFDCAQYASFTNSQFGLVPLKLVAVRTADGLTWKLAAPPNACETRAAHEAFRKRFIAVLQEVQTAHPQCSFDPAATCKLDTQLENRLGESFKLQVVLPPELQEGAQANPPTAEGEQRDCHACLLYQLPPPEIKMGLVLRAMTAEGLALGKQECYTLGEADSTLSDAARLVPVSIAFGKEDVRTVTGFGSLKGKSEDEGREFIKKRLLDVVADLFRLAREANFINEQGDFNYSQNSAEWKEADDKFTEAARYRYDVSRNTGIGWSRVSALSGKCSPNPKKTCGPPCSATDPPMWEIKIAGLQFMRRVNIRVIPDDIDLEFANANTDTGRALRRKRDRLAGSLRKSLGDLQAKPGLLLLSPMIEADKDKIESMKKVKAVKRVVSKPKLTTCALNNSAFTNNTNLFYDVVRDAPGEQILSLRGGVGFSVEQRFSGHIAVDAVNFLQRNEQFTLDHTQSLQVQKTRLNFKRPFPETKGWNGWRIEQYNVEVNYFRDKDQRLGNLMAEELALRETGSSAGIVILYDSLGRKLWQPGEKPSPSWRRRSRAEFELAYRDVNIPEGDSLLTVTGLKRSLLSAARGQVSNLTLHWATTLTYDTLQREGRGAREFVIGLNLDAQRGLSWFGADYQYGKASLILWAETLVGVSSPNDFLLRYVHGFQRAGSQTPVFELYRMGGASNVRGIEQGEFIGRRLTYDQVEFGVNLQQLARWLRRPASANHDKEAEADDESEKQADRETRQVAGFDYSKLFLNGFFDHGRVSDPTSFLNGATPMAFDRRVKGFGAAVELRNFHASDAGRKITFSLGYAWSPDSRLHRHGTLFTNVSIGY